MAGIMSTLGAAAVLLALQSFALDAQGKSKGDDKGRDKGSQKAQAAEQGQRGRDKAASERPRQAPAQAPGERGRARAAEVREVGGAVAGPADMAKANRNASADARAFKSSMKSGRYFRAYSPDDTPDRWRAIALSPRLTERYAGRVATLALARGVPQDGIFLRSLNDRVLISNAGGVVLLDLDDAAARDIGAWRVVRFHEDGDDHEGSPAFCRSGAGHPNWGRQWCIAKGFGLGSSNDMRWGRAVSVEDVILRPASTTTDLTRDVLASVLGSVVLNRLATHAITLGLVEPLMGRWAVEPTGRRVLTVRSGTVPVAEIVDHNKDGRADVMLVALKPW